MKNAELFSEEYYMMWEGYSEFTRHQISQRIAKALTHLNPKPKERILDIGCGRGEILRECARVGCDAVGIDASKASVKFSRGSGEIVLASATKLPFRDRTFNGVTLLAVLEHLRPKECEQSVQEIHRTLKKGGRLVIEAPYFGMLISKILTIYATIKFGELVEWKGLKFIQRILGDMFKITKLECEFSILESLKKKNVKSYNILQLRYLLLLPFSCIQWIITYRR